MRLEAVRQANNAAVLRQQVFHFDPNYYPYLNAVGGAEPGLPGAGQQPSVHNASVGAAGQLAGAASSTHSNMIGYAQELHGVHPSNNGSEFFIVNISWMLQIAEKWTIQLRE